MKILNTVAAMRAARAEAADLGLVPTMGYLHDGHLSLVGRAKAECSGVCVSIFVNPTQFTPSEDLGRYPRDLPRDLALLEEAGVDLVFVPEVGEIYPSGFATLINVGGITEVLEGAVRPGHFAGVATVVAKLFNIAQPTRAYFGQKDAQQSMVINKLVHDLDLPIEVIVVPTVREADGLALSSRNSYLTIAERAAAPVIFRALSTTRELFEAGERDADILRETMRQTLAREPQMKIDYVSVADLASLRELTRVGRQALASMAVRLGATRLIDNLMLCDRGLNVSSNCDGESRP